MVIREYTWNEVKERLIIKGIRYCEVWTQEDEAGYRIDEVRLHAREL